MVEITVPIGTRSTLALKEPVNFKVFVEGETIVRLGFLDVSYNHRGIEKAAEQRDFIRVAPLLERVCGICSHSHGTVFVKGVGGDHGPRGPSPRPGHPHHRAREAPADAQPPPLARRGRPMVDRRRYPLHADLERPGDGPGYPGGADPEPGKLRDE